MRLALVFAGFLLSAAPAWAGFIEVGVSGNYKHTNLSDESYDKALSMTGSLSYLFDQTSAIELSYTDGSQERFIYSAAGFNTTTTIDYRMIGLDFILTLGSQDAVLRPYFKVGVAHILEKNMETVYEGSGSPNNVYDTTPPATVPSAGIGAKIALSQQLSLKIGVDAWTSKSVSEDDYKWDTAGRAGLSWLF